MPDDPKAIGYPADDISEEQHQNIDTLIYILGNHADTQMHEVLMMYYWNIYFGEDVYDIDIDALLGLFNVDTFLTFTGYGGSGTASGGAGYSGGFVVKVDEPTTAPILKEEQLNSALEAWLSGEQLSNAKSVFTAVRDAEGTYKINSVFTYALMMQECGIGTASSSWVKENNWTSLVAYGHIQYPTPDANIEKFARMIATGKIYFSQGRDTVYEIGEKYCTSPPPPAWADGVSKYMMDIYNAAGVNVVMPSVGIGSGGRQEIVELAMQQQGKPYVWGASGPNSFDCSGLVQYVYSSLGISCPRSTSGYKSKKQYEINWSEAEPRRYTDYISRRTWIGLQLPDTQQYI